jgi:uncharacterized membrane protein YbjE (DUF340 family)
MDNMATQRPVGGINRAVAIALAVVWLCAAVAGLVAGVVHERPIMIAVAVFAGWYSALWFRVATERRLLRWRDVATPWRGWRSSSSSRT